MTHLFFICFLLLAVVNAHPMWSEENDDENNSYEGNQNGDEEDDNNSGSSENESPYDNQNSDNRGYSPYNFPSHSGQSDLGGGYDRFRPDRYSAFANNRMKDQPYEYNNPQERSEENDDENNSYEGNQNGDEENDNNSGSSENESPYDNQNSDNRGYSPYNFPSHSGQSDLGGGYDRFRPDRYNGFADNRMYDQPYEYNNPQERFHGSNNYNLDSSNGDDFSNENTEDDTENDYRREEAYTESYFPSSQSIENYRALKRKDNTHRFKQRTVFPSTDDFNRNPNERRSDSEHSFTFGGLGKGSHNKNIFNIHNKIIYTR